jgi:16S rRNA (guanine966-N2)-methyltransferase
VESRLRIIGGIWRSRQIKFNDTPGLRPTPSRVRETLFNWLQVDVVNSCCLDLYAGSGALGFEAASRGAKSVVQVENNLKACQKIQENITALAANQITLVTNDVVRFLQSQAEKYDLVFLDPPFGQNLIAPNCRLLEQSGCLADYAKIYIEAEKQLHLADIPSNWQLLKSQTAGEVGFYLFQRV